MSKSVIRMMDRANNASVLTFKLGLRSVVYGQSRSIPKQLALLRAKPVPTEKKRPRANNVALMCGRSKECTNSTQACDALYNKKRLVLRESRPRLGWAILLIGQVEVKSRVEQ